MTVRNQASQSNGTVYDVIVVGAGFGGLYALYKLRQLGLTVLGLEAGGGVGGTWFWNTYPGARCDNESVEYSYSFSPELQKDWRWTERYATQPEILAYLNHVAKRFDLYPHIRFDTRVTSAKYDESVSHWTIGTEAGASLETKFCVMASGNLSVSKVPDWPGMDLFQGTILHTAKWPPSGVDLAGKRVGVVGTGSSGVQVTPHIAAVAERVVVFQRTANFAVPAKNFFHPGNAPILPEDAYEEARERARHSPLGFFAETPNTSALAVETSERTKTYEALWNRGGTSFLLAFNDLLFDVEANATAAEFVRHKIRLLVKDPQTAERMVPRGYPIGAKRLCCEIGYYETFNRPNVELVDLNHAPVTEVTSSGITAGGKAHALDVLVFATGFDAMTGALKQIDIQGLDGRTLKNEWVDGPHAYLGLMTVGFPNLFLLTGPGSPSALSNVVVSIEQHVDWIAECLTFLIERSARRIESTAQAEADWMVQVDKIANRTIFMRARSWYQTTTRDGRRVFMPYLGGVGAYRQICRQVADSGYMGFSIDGA